MARTTRNPLRAAWKLVSDIQPRKTVYLKSPLLHHTLRYLMRVAMATMASVATASILAIQHLAFLLLCTGRTFLRVASGHKDMGHLGIQ